MIRFVKELLDIYEYQVLKEEIHYLVLKDLQTKEIIKKDTRQLLKGFLVDYQHKLDQSDCNKESLYYKETIRELENLLKIVPNGTKVQLVGDSTIYWIKGNDYETTEEFENLNYYIGKENDVSDNWIMALREDFIIIG